MTKDTLQLAHVSTLRSMINQLVAKYTHRFDNLTDLDYECCSETPIIAYNVAEHKVMFNCDMFDDEAYAESALAFISCLVGNKEENCNVPEGISSRAWNVAVHLRIVAQLKDIGEFEFPEDAIDFPDVEVHPSDPVQVIYDRLLEHSPTLLEQEFDGIADEQLEQTASN